MRAVRIYLIFEGCVDWTPQLVLLTEPATTGRHADRTRVLEYMYTGMHYLIINSRFGSICNH